MPTTRANTSWKHLVGVRFSSIDRSSIWTRSSTVYPSISAIPMPTATTTKNGLGPPHSNTHLQIFHHSFYLFFIFAACSLLCLLLLMSFSSFFFVLFYFIFVQKDSFLFCVIYISPHVFDFLCFWLIIK